MAIAIGTSTLFEWSPWDLGAATGAGTVSITGAIATAGAGTISVSITDGTATAGAEAVSIAGATIASASSGTDRLLGSSDDWTLGQPWPVTIELMVTRQA